MKQKDILLLTIPGFLLIVMWVIFSIYHNSVTSTIPENLTLQIVPIKPTFDRVTIEALKKRTQVAPIFEITKTSSIAAATPTPTQIPTVTPTISAPILSSPSGITNQSTQGGTLN